MRLARELAEREQHRQLPPREQIAEGRSHTSAHWKSSVSAAAIRLVGRREALVCELGEHRVDSLVVGKQSARAR